MNKYWKRFSFYEGLIAISFIIAIFFYIINKDFLTYILPKDISAYFFWLTLGLLLGFRLCKYEYTRIWKKMKAEEQKNATGKQNPPISPN